jgi:hypothetical protein
LVARAVWKPPINPALVTNGVSRELMGSLFVSGDALQPIWSIDCPYLTELSKGPDMGTVRRLAADLRLTDLGHAVSIVGFNHDVHAGTLSGFIVRQTKDVVDIHLDGIPETVAVTHDAIVLILEPNSERETEPGGEQR